MIKFFVKSFLFVLIIFLGSACGRTPTASVTNTSQKNKTKQPNIILLMADDHGWGDTGYNGNRLIKTPHLDKMSADGIEFSRFYAAAPVCSPTRASCLTGRHPFRMGIYFANTGHLKKEELTIAEVLKKQGYKTGHFGKWHLGTLTNDEIDANRGGRSPEHYAPPWDNGFDVCFSTESKVPTWDPMITPAETAEDVGKRKANTPFGTSYWTGPKQKVRDNLDGDDSRVIMDRVIPFLETSSKDDQPFFAVIWFHTPHLPVIAGKKYRDMYANESVDVQHYYGCITAMDEQIGRMRKELENLGLADNTMLFYTSDNGPEGKKRVGRKQGSTGGLKGRKRSLNEGGVRVPGIWVWPNQIKQHQKLDFPVCTSDYFPTIMDILNINIKNAVNPIDGISLAPILKGKMKERNSPIGFQSRKQAAWVEDRYKLYTANGKEYELYDLKKDPSEQNNIISTNASKAEKMKTALENWMASTKRSDQGMDYTVH